MYYNNVSFFDESCQLLFENKVSSIFYEQIYFYDNKKNYFFDTLYIIIKLITLFICYEYKALIKQLIITSHHFLIVTFSKKQTVIEHQWNLRPTPSIEERDSTRITLQKNSYFAQFSSAHLNYISKICVILEDITMNFFRFFKDGVFSKNQFVRKKLFFIIKFAVKIFPKNTTTSAI